MSTIPSQSSLITDAQAYTVECAFCSAKVGEQCINLRSLTDSTREPQTYSAGVHKSRIKAYKALHLVAGVEHAAPATIANKQKPNYPQPVVKPNTDEDVIYVPIDGLEEPLPMKVKTVEIYAVIQSSEKAIQVENLNQYTAWIPKSVVISSSRNVLHIKTTFQINWIKTVTQ